MKVLIYPKGDNPYQELLYQPMRGAHPGDRFDYLEATASIVLLFPFISLLKRLQGYRVFHLHWPAFAIRRNIPGIRQFSRFWVWLCLTSLRLWGFKVVWTVHNVLPHDAETSNDPQIARYLSRLAAAKIVHTADSLRLMRHYALDVSRTTTIPHGNYDGVYPNVVSRSMARRRFGIPADAPTFLFFGRIEAYKQLPLLLAAYQEVAREQPEVHLIIAGKCPDDSLLRTLQDAARADPHIHAVLGFIPDDDVQYYFRAADAAAYPFKEITTSGSVILGLTFGAAVIAPRLGALRDFPSGVGLLYSAQDPSGLARSLKLAAHDPASLQAMRRKARHYADSLSWPELSTKTYALYVKVLT